MFDSEIKKTIIGTLISTVLMALIASNTSIGLVLSNIVPEFGSILILGSSVVLELVGEKLIFKDFSFKKKISKIFNLETETKNCSELLNVKIEQEKVSNYNKVIKKTQDDYLMEEAIRICGSTDEDDCKIEIPTNTLELDDAI